MMKQELDEAETVNELCYDVVVETVKELCYGETRVR